VAHESFVHFLLLHEEASLSYLQDMESGFSVTDGSNAETSHVIATTIHGRNGLPKQVRVVFLPVFVHETYPTN
jgi:hypothetical protein